jgi:Ca-activated chloride channel family protein
MNFVDPWLLIGIPIATSLVLISLLRQRRGGRSGYSLLAASMRSIIIAFTITALATPYTSSTKPAEAITALVDISASITIEQGDQLLDKARSLAEELSVPLRVAAFGKIAAPDEISLSPGTSYRELREMWRKLDTGGTNLGAVLTSANSNSTTTPLLLLSDGYETIGSVKENTSQLGTRPIFPLTALGEDGDTDLSISQLHAPLTVLAQRSVDVRATITNALPKERSSSAQAATLEVRHGDRVILSRSVEVPRGEDLSFVAQSDPSLEGLQPIQAKLSWRDATGPHVVTKTIWLSGEKRNKVLLLSGSVEDDRYLSRILTNQAYQLKSSIASSPEASVGAAEDYKVIVLNNVHISKIPTPLQTSLARYVENGGGLVVIGGNTSFGLGGYIGSTLEPLLPLRLVPPHQEKKRLNIAVQLVIDKSRSMATDNRLEFAKASAEEVVRLLLDEDYLGVIGFDEVPFIALPLSPLRSVRSTALGRISRLFPTSRTNLFPALDEARRGLSAINAGRKHIIVLTDGKLPDPGQYYFDLVKQARFLGITLSTIMVGTEADDGFLARLAQVGGGAFYQTADPRNLPRVFLSDVKVASGERTLKEEPQLSVRNGPDPIVSTSLTSFPSVRGFVETQERANANTELIVRSEEGAYPLLASWKVGKGSSIAFTSDANGRWSSEWMRWDSVQEFWSDVVETAQAKRERSRVSNLQFDLRAWLEGGEVVVDLSVFEEIASRDLQGIVTTPQGDRVEIDLAQVRPGNYQARLANATAGTYRAEIRIGDSSLPPVAWELPGELFGEQPHRVPNTALLSEIASRTGGSIDPSPDMLRPLMKQESTRTTYSHPLLVAALLLFFLELMLRVSRAR